MLTAEFLVALSDRFFRGPHATLQPLSNPLNRQCVLYRAAHLNFQLSQPATKFRQRGPYTLSYYVPKSDSANTQKGFGSAALALQLFSDTVAPYPYEKLALIIGATQFGGMENSRAIVFTTKLLDARPSAGSSQRFGIPCEVEDVVAHEIAHQLVW
jgi:hypothetical protein